MNELRECMRQMGWRQPPALFNVSCAGNLLGATIGVKFVPNRAISKYASLHQMKFTTCQRLQVMLPQENGVKDKKERCIGATLLESTKFFVYRSLLRPEESLRIWRLVEADN